MAVVRTSGMLLLLRIHVHVVVLVLFMHVASGSSWW